MSVVGKYRYFMHSPAERDSVPVIVDIILVGRTKIITLHSSVWLENLTDRRVAFRLHVPITPLVAPAPARGAAPEQQAELKSDTLLGPLPPGEGVLACNVPEPQDAMPIATQATYRLSYSARGSIACAQGRTERISDILAQGHVRAS